ncbi:Uncharacterized protein GBIM_11482 [Gryllus bimaculatus]|nr:Uncharacterized protein GBIM_11482 [Gryllus bimaculatus]
MSSPSLLYTVFYVLIAVCFVFPSSEFVSAGFTIQNLFENALGSEHENFILYHIRRTVVTILIHSLLPFGYLFGLCFLGFADPWSIFSNAGYLWTLFVIVSIVIPVVTLIAMYLWWKENWRRHPIVKTLKLYANGNDSWEVVASDINIEFRRIDKFCVNTNSVVKVIATDNWVLKVSPYTVQCAHQSDSALVLISSDTHHLTPSGPGTVQYLNIEVKPTRAGVKGFTIRLDALDFRDLQDKLSRPIVVLQNVTFHRTVIDRFLEAFREQVADNPVYRTNEELEPCIGCMQCTANVKLLRTCGETVLGEEPCTNCYCRPMWCVDCMGKFASRQDPQRTETWMSMKCTCPLCRSRFCVLDICFIESQ